MPLAHFGVMFLAGEIYRRNYPNETFLQVNQAPWVIFVGLVISVVGFYTLALLVLHAYRADSFNKTLRILWIGNLVLFGVFSVPVYFHRFIMNPGDSMIQEKEIIVALKFAGLFLFTSTMFLVYQGNVFQPYLLTDINEGTYP